ncbi:MAG: hypothetical protein ACRD6W_06550, partial [Nitrososphaerales archaeon]
TLAWLFEEGVVTGTVEDRRRMATAKTAPTTASHGVRSSRPRHGDERWKGLLSNGCKEVATWRLALGSVPQLRDSGSASITSPGGTASSRE